MTTKSAEDALAFVFVALEHARTAKQEAYLAAGALEHLLRRHGALVIDRVLGAARQDPKFRRCLAGVWGHSGMEKTVRERIDEILAPPKIFSEATAKKQALETSLKYPIPRRHRVGFPARPAETVQAYCAIFRQSTVTRQFRCRHRRRSYRASSASNSAIS